MPPRPVLRGSSWRGANRGGGRNRGRGRGVNRRDGGNRATRDHSHTGHGPVPDQKTFQNAISNLSSVLDSIKQRLDNLEGNTAQNRRPQSDHADLPHHTNHQPHRANNQNKRWSQNPDFKELVRCNTKYVQIQHHYKNWQECPKGVSKAIDNLIDNIRPPQPTADLQKYLREAADDFKSNLAGVLQAHLHRESNIVEKEIASLQQTDQDLMQSIVTNKLKRRLGRRIGEDTIKDAFEKYQRHHPAWSSVQRPESDVEEDDDETSDMEVAYLNVRRAASKRHHSPASSNSSPNDRPSKLPTNSNSPPITQGDKPLITAVAELAAEAGTSTRSDRGATAAATGSRTSPKVTHRTAREVRSWSLDGVQPATTTVIVADSNGGAFADTELPHHYQVFSFGGMNLHHAARLITSSEQQLQNTQNIVVAVGVNDRDSADDSNILSSLNAINDWGYHQRKRIIFSAVPISPRLTENTARKISHINELARDTFEDNFIPSVDTSEFAAKPDRFGIHYTSSTADKILRGIINHLN